MKSEKITIIGGGNGAFAAAADLTIRGHQITLFEMPAFADSIKGIQEKGGIDLECLPSNQLKGGFAKLHKITSDIKEALKDSDIVFIITPAYAHANIAAATAPYIREEMIVVLTPANFGGSIIFREALIKNGCSEKTKVAEFDTMMYATRKTSATSSWIRGYKHNLGCAVFPSENSNEIFERLKGIYPYIIKRDNVLVTGVSNVNSYGHPPVMIGNISLVDGGTEPLMNTVKTESLARLRKALDDEHMGLRKIGINVFPMGEIYQGYYEYQGAVGTTDEAWRNNPIYVDSKLPKDWQHRYLTEDIPFGLVPIEELLEQYNLPHPIMTAFINFANLLCGKDFRQAGMKLEYCHLKGLTEKQLHQYLTYGTY